MIKDNKEEIVFLKKAVCLEPGKFSLHLAIVKLDDGKRTNQVDVYTTMDSYYGTRIMHEDAYEKITDDEVSLMHMLFGP